MDKNNKLNTANFLPRAQLIKELVSKELEMLHLISCLMELSSELNNLSASIGKILMSSKERRDRRGEEHV